MPEEIRYALIYFSLALLCYSIGVWSERVAKTLKLWHLLFFWLGLLTDTLGTEYVARLVGGFQFSFHTITGMLGLLLMAVHTIWATVIVVKKDEKWLHTFHKFSLFVWLIWLIPYFTGFFVGLNR